MNESTSQLISIPKINKRILNYDQDVSESKILLSKKNDSSQKCSDQLKNIDISAQKPKQKAFTQRFQPQKQQEQRTESDLGSQWAHWNINNIKIAAPIHEEEDEEIFLPSKPKRKKSKSHERKLQSPKKNKRQQKKEARQKQNAEKERRRHLVNNVLAGKTAFIWLFILGDKVGQSEISVVEQLYKDADDNGYASPICRNFEEAYKFLALNSIFLKIVTDLEHSEQVVEEAMKNTNIISIYFYTPAKFIGNSKLYELKRKSRKVKGIFARLQEAVQQVSQQMLDEARFINVNDTLQFCSKPRMRFPSFFVLTGNDSSQVNAYRLCLFGAIKLQNNIQKAAYLYEFVDMVKLRYADNKRQLKNLEDYKLLDHFSDNYENKYTDILKFYVQENFYYSLTNSLLKLARSSDQFKPCTIPFHQTYHAIKYFHNKSNERRQMTTFRGAKLKLSDVNALAIGSYVQLLGFTSTSLSKVQALKFMDQDSYLIQIYVQESFNNQIDEHNYAEHGFVDINKYQLATEGFKQQEEILFNALNVYKVTAIDLNSPIRTISLKYGALAQLTKKAKQKLTQKQFVLLRNMQFCFDALSKIEDDGDVLLLSEQYEKAKEYYQNKIEDEKSSKTYAKLACIQAEIGSLDQAESNALKALQLLRLENGVIDDNSSLHSSMLKISTVLSTTQNIEGYQQLTEIQLKLSNNCLTKTQILIQRSDIRLNRGEIDGGFQDLLLAIELLIKKQESFKQRRKQVERLYFFKSLCVCHSTQLSMNLQAEKDAEMLNIEQDQINYFANSDKINQLKIKISEMQRSLYERKGDFTRANEYSQSSKKYFKKIQEKDEDLFPIEAARYYALQAMCCDKNNPGQYQHLMQTAIDIMKDVDPFHADIGKYSKMLAQQRYNRIQQTLNPSIRSTNNAKKQTKRQKLTQSFNYNDHKELYRKCQSNFSQAINNFIYNKGLEHPESMQTTNKLVELDLEFSLLAKAEEETLLVSQRKMSEKHSEGAKCFLLLSKIALAKGQLKRSFKTIQKASQILRNVLDPKGNQKYLIKHPLFLEANLVKAKIFNKQSRHDLALRQLHLLQKITSSLSASDKIRATIYEQKAEVLVCQGQTLNFQELMLKAIDIRSKVMGRFNIANAMTYSYLSKYLRLRGNEKASAQYHQNSVKIFYKFPVDHPNSWIIHLLNAYTYLKDRSNTDIVKMIQQCLRVLERRYSPNHISLMKIKLQIGQLFKLIGMESRAISLYEVLDKQIQKQIKISSSIEQIERQADDEKISLRKQLLRQMQSLYISLSSNQASGMVAAQKCEYRLKQFESGYTVEKIESLKSLF